MAQGDIHEQSRNTSSYEFLAGKYARMVALINSSGSIIDDFGLSTADGATFTAGTSEGTPMMGVHETTPTTVTNNDLAVIGIDINRNVRVTLATALGRAIDSITAYQAPCEITIVDLATDADVVVTPNPAVLLGFYIDTVMSAHVALIKDSSTTKITIPASTAAGVKYETHSASFATNITVESDNSATGKVAIFWRAA